MAALFSLVLLFSCSSKTLDSIIFEAMDTYMSVKSFGKNAHKANILVQNEISKIENQISVTDSHSEVYKINSSQAEQIFVSDTLASLIDFTLETASRTDGAFNPFLYPVTKEWGFTTKKYHVPELNRIQELLEFCDYNKAEVYHSEDGNIMKKLSGMQLDFGAIGKGYAGDCAIKQLRENSIKSAILDLGGNVQLLGSKNDGSDWNIGLKNPWEASANPVLALKLSDKAVITSGGYERFFTGDDGQNYIHIFDGSTGCPVRNNLVSVTIICDEGLIADALSTSLFVMGKEKSIDFWKNDSFYDFEMILIFDDYSLLYSENLKDKITVLYDFSNVQVVSKNQE